MMAPSTGRGPNELLRLARLRRLSPSGSGRVMSRQEVADAVNAYLAARGFNGGVDGAYVGKLERGVHRWPQALYREALRAVLGVSSDAELGLYICRRVRAEDAALVLSAAN
jgi:hypothetical protein